MRHPHWGIVPPAYFIPDDGLDWTKPVRDYIPEFRLHDAVATDRVTVRDLLCHQTGLPRHDWVWILGDRSVADLLGSMRHLELSRDIRAAWQYNNLCYNVVGLLISQRPELRSLHPQPAHRQARHDGELHLGRA